MRFHGYRILLTLSHIRRDIYLTYRRVEITIEKNVGNRTILLHLHINLSYIHKILSQRTYNNIYNIM